MSCLEVRRQPAELTPTEKLRNGAQTFELKIQNPAHRCFTTTMIKVGVVVLGLLLIGAAIAMYFSRVNAIASYATAGVGGVAILGVALWSIISCLRGKSKGVKELTMDLKQEDNPKITEAQVTELLKNNPNIKQLRIDLKIHSLETKAKWNPDFKALNQHFTWNGMQSSGVQYVYDRKLTSAS